MKIEYKVKNLMKDQRKFFDRHAGKVVVLNSGEVAITTCPPKNKEVFEVKRYEIKKNKKLKEED